MNKNEIDFSLNAVKKRWINPGDERIIGSENSNHIYRNALRDVEILIEIIEYFQNRNCTNCYYGREIEDHPEGKWECNHPQIGIGNLWHPDFSCSYHVSR